RAAAAAAADPALRAPAEALARLVPARLDEMARTVALQRAGRGEEALKLVATDEGRTLTEGIRAAAAQLRTAAAGARADTEAAVARIVWTSAAAATGMALTGLALGLFGLAAQRRTGGRPLRGENRFDTLAETLPGFIWTARPDGEVDWQSAPWHAFSGTRPGRSLGMRWLDFVHPEDREAAGGAWSRAVGTGRAFEAEMRLRAADGSWRWHLARALPERDRVGRVARWVASFTDIDARHRAEEGLRAGEERMRLALRAAGAAIYDHDLDTGTVLRSADHARLFGAEDVTGADWVARIHPDDAPAVLSAMRAAREPGGAPGWDLGYRVRRADGGWRHVRDRALVWRDLDGRAGRIVGGLLEVTRLREAEAAQAQLAALVACAGDAIVLLAAEDRRILAWNAAAERLLGWRESEAIGADAALFLPPDPQEGDVPLLRADGPVQDHETECLTRGGQRVPVWATASRVTGPDGRAFGTALILRDLRPRREAGAHERTRFREMDHRAKNVLTVVQSVVRLTRADNVEEFARRVEGRVAALGRAQALLARQDWRGAMLHELLREELAAWDTPRGSRLPEAQLGRLLLSGPPVRLCPTAVQPLAMVVHELATNAAKHGALSVAAGRLEISWGFGTDGRLRLHWVERDGPPVLAPPARRGFGKSVVEATIRAQLAGEARLDWETEGLSAMLVLGLGRAHRGTGAQPPAPEPAGAPAGHSDPTLRSQPDLPLRGRRVLLAEDEPLQALELRAMLEGLGCTVLGPASTLEETQAILASERGPDAAVLGVNLDGRPSFPVADALAIRGIPVAFLTTHGDLPSRAAADGRSALLRRPVERTTLGATLRHMLAASNDDQGRGVA
ncbi:MAG TPA: PAS domain-containing protein, partial [Acetobacteraceae bacterium]|nr:PAS domain-containing protein [Acetobacteraceae bacterium]